MFIRSINALPQTLQKLVDAVERETGYAIVVLWGGPQVNENGSVGTWQYVPNDIGCDFVYNLRIMKLA